MVNTDDCELWAGAVDRDDYGYMSIKIDGRWTTRPIHRLLYEAERGDVPKSLVMDHLCRTRRCINLTHLEPVTNRVNVQRGVFKSSSITHCVHGHEYTPENTMRKKNSRRRQCRECHRLSCREQYRKRKLSNSTLTA